MGNNNHKNILVDSHVHLYENFNPDSFIESISRNFKKHSKLDENGFTDSIKMIFLTEAKENDFFSRLRENSLPLKNMDIHAEPGGEEGVLLLKQNGTDLFYIVRGRQVITEENVEILSVGGGTHIGDGPPAEKVMSHIRKQGQLAILAWGVGKWFLKRGKLVKKLINSTEGPLTLLGDNSARPVLWLKPFIFRKGERKGFPVVAGSDPLPLEGEDKKAGSYFFMVKGPFNPKKPLDSLKNILGSEGREIKNMGKRDSLLNFFRRQGKIMLKKYT